MGFATGKRLGALIMRTCASLDAAAMRRGAGERGEVGMSSRTLMECLPRRIEETTKKSIARPAGARVPALGDAMVASSAVVHPEEASSLGS
eukprot:2175443-Pyramimonas_sp.AAC.1